MVAHMSTNVAFPSLFSLVFLMIGGAIISFAIRMAAKARQSLSWPSIEGEISHSAVLYQTNTTDRTAAPTWKADIAYRYKVGGRNYSSSRISILDFASSSTSRAENIVSRYPDKSTVQVYYNPTDPSDSVLEPGSAGGVNVAYLVGGLFAAAGLFFLIMSMTGHVHFNTGGH